MRKVLPVQEAPRWGRGRTVPGAPDESGGVPVPAAADLGRADCVRGVLQQGGVMVVNELFGMF